MYLEGRADPKLPMVIYFEKPGANPVVLETNANSNGEWFVAQKLELGSGEWMVRTRTLSDPPSEWSNPRILRSVVSGLVLGSLKIKYAYVVLLLLLIIAASVGLLIYSFVRVRTVQRKELEKEMREKTAVLEKALQEKERQLTAAEISQHFDDLRKKVSEHEDQEEHKDRLLKELREAEELIEKKVKEERLGPPTGP